MADKPFALIGVHLNIDGEEAGKVKEVMAKEKLNWRSFSSRAIAAKWSARGTPTYYVIDHKGVMDEYKLTDGTPQKSVFREPQTWAFLESFKVRNDMIVGVEATFIQAPYYMRAPWTKKPDKR